MYRSIRSYQNRITPMRVLITGGAGFIGSHLADALIARGDQVVALDNFSTGSTANIKHITKNFEIIDGDIRNTKLINEATKDVDLVLHMAAALGVNTILESPLESISTNITGSEVVLSAAARYKKRILIASTSEIYGKNPNQPLKETDDRVVGSPQKIRWSYSDAKAIEEAMAVALHQEKNLQVTTARLFNTVGPRQSGRYGMVIPRFVKAALSNKPLNIYGDGTQSRVFCHVQDAIEALLKLVAIDKAINEVYNVGGTGEITIKELADTVIKETKSQSSIEFIPYEKAYAPGFEDMQRRVPDISKIKEALNWSPQRELTQIISDVASHISNS
jgi:UDP-glucose 4-epimerase